MMDSGVNLITTIAGFGMSAAFMVFVCARIFCGRIRYLQSQQRLEVQPRVDLEQQQQQVGALEAVVVAAIPTMEFNSQAFTSLEDALCSICLGEYKGEEVLRIMPKCGHNFHLSCIDLWLQKQATCPVCRLPLQSSHSVQPKSILVMSSSINAPQTSMKTLEQFTGGVELEQDVVAHTGLR